MIDIQPYIYKLEMLKAYMNEIIDWGSKGFWIDINAIPRMNPDKFLQLYAETGMIFYDGNPPPSPIPITFEQWLKLKTNSNA
jgi:hypothetical protein